MAALLAKRGFRWIKGDELARSLYRPGSAVWKSLKREFGGTILGPKGRVDRKALGSLVFRDRRALSRLNALVHPALVRLIRAKLRGASRVCVDMAVYFQAGAPDFGGKLCLVEASKALRIRRLVGKGLSPERAKAQASSLRFTMAQRRACHAVLRNEGNAGALRRSVELLLHTL